MTLTNKERGEVAFPEAGEGAFLVFTVGALEQLETKFGENYFDTVLDGLRKVRVPVFNACIAVGMQKATKPFPFGMSLEEIQGRIVDALFMCVYGKTFEEQQKAESELLKKRMEEAKENPLMAAALYSQLSGGQGTAQG